MERLSVPLKKADLLTIAQHVLALIGSAVLVVIGAALIVLTPGKQSEPKAAVVAA